MPDNSTLARPDATPAPRAPTQPDTDVPLRPGITPSGQVAIPLVAGSVCLVLVALGLRPGIVSIGPLLPQMIDEFGLSHTQASLLTAIPTLLMGLLALSTPWLAARFGRDRAIIAALLLLALATGARALAGSSATLFLATAGVGAGIAIAGALIPGFVKASFPGRVAMLMGIYAMALSLGSMLAAGATGALAQLLGNWRVPAAIWAIPAVVGIVGWYHIEQRGRVVTSPADAAQRHRLPLHNPTAWLVAAFFAFNNVVFYGYISWIAPLYVELGRSATAAGLILACFTLAFMVASPIFGAISRNEDRRPWLALSAGIGFIGVLWMAISPTSLPFIAVSLVAFGTSGAFTLSMTLPLDNARSDGEATAWNAFVMLVSYLIGATGPVLVGFLRDASGSFAVPLWVLVAVSTAMLATTPFLQPHHHRLAAARRRRDDRFNQTGEVK